MEDEFAYIPAEELTRRLRETFPLSPSLGQVTRDRRKLIHLACQRLDYAMGRAEAEHPAERALRFIAFQLAHEKTELGENAYTTQRRAEEYYNALIGK